MITFSYALRGVVFEKPEAPWDAATFAMQDAVVFLGQRLKSNLSGGILRTGPGRYGHLAQQIQGETRKTADQLLGRVHATGKAAFRAPILEGGAVGHFIGPRRRHRALRFRAHGADVVRAYAHHPGMPATHVFERTLEGGKTEVLAMFDKYVAKVLA